MHVATLNKPHSLICTEFNSNIRVFSADYITGCHESEDCVAIQRSNSLF